MSRHDPGLASLAALLALVLPLFVGGCGSSATPVEGSVRGRGLKAAGAAFHEKTGNAAIYVVEPSPAQFCDALSQRKVHMNTADLTLEFADFGPGEYKVADGLDAYMVFNGSTSASTWTEQATAGSLTVEAISSQAQTASGSFDLTFPGGSLKGSFDAVPCAL